ncbi:MAG: LysR family transcriptional regulator [Hyphomicrobiaceae bacterium]|nr:LysR family transcriptional regulator [Hyphomicrobiaceae bacterium]
MDKLSAMTVFTRVVALGSFAEAARALGMTRSAASKAVMELETRLGVRLFDRTTRRVSATEAGLAYYERCVDILARVEETEMQVARLHDEPRGVLKVNAPMSFGVRYLGPAVADFMAEFADLTVELTLTDRFIDPIEEGVDVTIRVAALADSSLIARRLAPARIAIAAAPTYLDRHGRPSRPEDLAGHRVLHYGHATTLPRWHLGQGESEVAVRVTSVLCCNNGDVLREAAVAGHGIVRLPTFLIGPDIAAGRLVELLAEHRPPDLAIAALYAPNRYLAAKTRAFIDFLVARFGQTPPWEPADTGISTRRRKAT